MSFRVDINCDLGESFGRYRLGQDDQVLHLITSANIACGFHAGDSRVMYETVKFAHELGVGIGAHPGYPDLQGFGRREVALSPDEIYEIMVYQIGAMQGFARIFGERLQHVKPHGALYNRAAKDQAVAEAVAQAIVDLDDRIILFGLARSQLIKEGKRAGLQVANEVFADRSYQSNGMLTPRSQSNAMIHDSSLAVERVIRMVKEGKVETVDGSEIQIQADTICVHGDEPTALEFVQKLRQELQQAGVKIIGVGDQR